MGLRPETGSSPGGTTEPLRRVAVFSFAPPGLVLVCPIYPRLKPWAIFVAPLDGFADTSALERKIDQRNHALYGLSPEEIKIGKEADAIGC